MDLGVSTIGKRKTRSLLNSKTTVETATLHVLEVLERDSRFFESNPPSTLPSFEASELELSEEPIGNGEFGVVFSVQALHVKEECPCPNCQSGTPWQQNPNPKQKNKQKNKNKQQYPKQKKLVEIVVDHNDSDEKDQDPTLTLNPHRMSYNNHDNNDDDATDDDDDDSTLSTDDDEDDDSKSLVLLEDDGEAAYLRGYMSTHCVGHGRPRYAIKRLRHDEFECEEIQLEAAIDLASEAKFLASLHHPNIVKMRGTVGTPGTPAFGIVMDCLVLTLREKMDQQWNHVAGSTPRNFLGRFLARHKPPDPEVYADQLVALYDIARAMRYLHNHMLLFRDLKPENVAYDIRGDMRLFDFGLAKELAVKDLVEGDDYHCTGLTGSRRYMAPEVIACKDYGMKADVYSYAIVVWEVVAGQSAYKHHAQTLEDHFEHVVVKGKRPSKRALKGSQLSNTLVQLVQDMWDGDSARRPTFRTICDQLTVDYNRLNDSGCGGAMDRSQQLLNRSLRSICDSGDSLDG